MFATGMTVSYEQLLIDAEIIRFVKRFMSGIDTSEEKLAYKSLMDVEHGKDFLADSLTLKYIRSDEHIKSLVSNRRNYQLWMQSGAPDIVENAEKSVRQILSSHEVEKLDEITRGRIAEVISEFESRHS